MTTTTKHDDATAISHDRKVSVVRQPVGWEVREEEGQNILRSVTVTDWHRVERAVLAFAHSAQPVSAAR